MRKKEHSGSAAVIGAQLVILFILTVSLCVQSRKAAAENTYAVMEKNGEGSRAGENFWHISGRSMAEILSGSGRRIWTQWWRN